MININFDSYRETYQEKKPYPYISFNNPIDLNIAYKIQDEILNIKSEDWDRYNNPFEQKYTLRDKNNLPKYCDLLFKELQEPKFVKKLSEFVGYDLLLDETKNFWGIHKYYNNDYLDIHVDAGLHPTNNLKKMVTLGIYLSKNWEEKNGGHLEVWDGDLSNNDGAKIYKCVDKILPSFNKMIIFTNTDNSWHGNPSKVVSYKDETRIFLTISYLTEDNNNFLNKRKKAFFVPRPEDKYDEEKDKLRYLRASIDNYKNIYDYNHKKRTIVTITGIRPDFIRMSEIFKKLDKEFNHVLIHTGQHYDKLLSDVFFDELEIRKPDYTLNTGSESSNHYEQLSYLTINIPKLFSEKNINPDLIIFLGDSNTSGVAFPLKKAGYKICHIEAGMRSFDKRMLEEINRTVCDHCSAIHFVYHEEYRKFLENENLKENVYVVGNTITEVGNKFKNEIMKEPKKRDMILMDIHRPENFKYPERLKNIIKFGNECYSKYNLPVKILYFKGLKENLEKNNISLNNIEMINLMSYKKYLSCIYNCSFIISDSGTGQEEPALFNTKVLVPRDYTERPQSYESNCSYYLNVNENNNFEKCFEWVENDNENMCIKWLGEGNTSELIIKHLKEYFIKN